MEIGEVFYPKNRKTWRAWLEKNHTLKTEIWVQKYRKATGKPTISYDDLVEQSLCFGWIDGISKKFDPESSVQRVSIRRKKTFLSELNRQRVWKLQHLGLMTEAGVRPIADQIGAPSDPLEIPDWLEKKLQEDPQAWSNFQAFPHFYKRLKVGWITEANIRTREEEVMKRLNHCMRMTAQNKRYGTEPLADISLKI